jgi:hypothetical protein
MAIVASGWANGFLGIPHKLENSRCVFFSMLLRLILINSGLFGVAANIVSESMDLRGQTQFRS